MLIYTLDKNIRSPSKEKDCLQFLNDENQFYERLGINTIKFKIWRNFSSLFICILAFMLNFKICLDINIRPMSRTIEYKGNFLI